jgi:hypothetical protein
MIAIQFIETVNPDDDAGQFVTSWPRSRRGKKAREQDKAVIYS